MLDRNLIDYVKDGIHYKLFLDFNFRRSINENK
jgi:hypothetical protein